MFPQTDQSSILLGHIQIGSAPEIIRPVNIDLWQFLLTITFCPFLVSDIARARFPAVEPLSRKKVFFAPNASAASS